MADAQQAKDLVRQIQEERGRGLMIRRGVLGVILLMFVAFFGNIYVKASNFDSDAFLGAIEKQASTQVWPAYSKMLEDVANDAVPAISEALADEAENLLPKVSEKLTAEGEIFQVNMGQYMKAALDREMLVASKLKEEQLKAEFPRFSEEDGAYEDLMVRLQASAQVWAQGQLDGTFEDHIRILQSINETVSKLMGQAQAERAKSGDQSMEDVLTVLAEIMNARVAGG